MLPWFILCAAVAGVIVLAWRSRGKRRALQSPMTLEKGDLPPDCPMSSIKPSPFNWTEKDPLKIRPFKPLYHMTMALQNSPPEDLIIMDRNYRDRVLERRGLMIQHPSIVVGAIPQGKPAVQELYTFLMSDYLPSRFPSMFSLDQDKRMFRNAVTGKSSPVIPPSDPVEALRILGETVEDDMFLLHETDKGHRNVAYVCCYCSGFDPSKKLDKLLVEIHEPVPSYDKIGPSMERFFSRVEVGKNVKRSNWSIVDSPILFNCGSNHVNAADVDNVVRDEDVDIGKTHMRVELQTLSRLPKTRAVLFSFKTHLYTLEEIKAEGLGPDLAIAIEGLGKGNAPGMWTYKGAIRWAKKVKEFLRS